MTSYSSVEEINHAISITDNTVTENKHALYDYFWYCSSHKKKIHGDEEHLTSRLLPSLIKKKHGVLWCQQLLSV